MAVYRIFHKDNPTKTIKLYRSNYFGGKIYFSPEFYDKYGELVNK